MQSVANIVSYHSNTITHQLQVNGDTTLFNFFKFISAYLDSYSS